MRIFPLLTDVLMHAHHQAEQCRTAASRYERAAIMLEAKCTPAQVGKQLGFQPIGINDCRKQAATQRGMAVAYEDMAKAFEECLQYNELPEDVR